MAVTIDGVGEINGVVLPTTSFGKVLQVVTNKTGAINVATTSSSFVTTGVTISITPQVATSKIIIGFTGLFRASTANYSCMVGTFRGTVDGTSLGPIVSVQSGAAETRISLSSTSFDEPNTTSATTYTIGFRSDGGFAASAGIGTVFTMYAIEVSA